MAIVFPSGTLSAPTKVLQVVSVPKTSHYNSSTKNSWTTITGLTASITPTSTSSKILVMVMLSEGGSGNNYQRAYRVVRGSTGLNIGAALSGSGQGGFTSMIGSTGVQSYYPCATIPFTYLDSPNTTSSTSYSVQFYANSVSGIDTYINRPYASGVNYTLGSSITIMEIGA